MNIMNKLKELLKISKGNAYVEMLDLSNPYLAKQRIENYLKQHPNNNLVKLYYARDLINLCEFDRAQSINSSVELEGEGRHYKLMRHLIINNEARLLSANDKYTELLAMIEKYPEEFSDEEKECICNYCATIMGCGDAKRDGSYRARQYLQYNWNEFYEHIKKHSKNYTKYENISNATFNQEFKTCDVALELKNILPKKEHIYRDFFEDVYYFKYDNCGMVGDKATDYFKVVCLKGTNNIITIYPTCNVNDMIKYTDINYVKDITVKVKTNIPTVRFIGREQD